jgi:hypothetical protein
METIALPYIITDRQFYLYTVFYIDDEPLHFVRVGHFFIRIVVFSLLGESSLPETCVLAAAFLTEM